MSNTNTNINLCIDCIHYPDDCTTDYTVILYDSNDNVIACPDFKVKGEK